MPEEHIATEGTESTEKFVVSNDRAFSLDPDYLGELCDLCGYATKASPLTKVALSLRERIAELKQAPTGT
jgi:hypothetical protein